MSLLVFAMVSASLGGCEPTAVENDAGSTLLPEDAAVARVDAGPPPIVPREGCGTNADCEDGNACTENTCADRVCFVRNLPGCFDCTSDADCDDGFTCSIESCVGGFCDFQFDNVRCDCTEAVHCDDGNPATEDFCIDYRCLNEAVTCATDVDCEDSNDCTTDRCVDMACANEPISGCGMTCPDRDGDGHGSRYCVSGRGDDCDDRNAAVNPSAVERCDDGIDNDCDGRIDRVDEDCVIGATTCATATELVPGTPATGSIIDEGSSGMTRAPCGEPNYHTVTITELSDLEVTVTLSEPPPPVPVPGCPECTEGHRYDYWFQLFFETTCGDVATDIGGSGSSCRSFSNDSFFSGDPTHTISLRRVPPGTYTVEVQAQDFFGWMPVAIDYTLSATVTPSDAPACASAPVLEEGVPVSGRTASGVDAFGLSCTDGVVSAEESLYSFTLAERRRIRLEAVGTPDPMTMIEPGLRLGVLSACDSAAPRVACLEHTGYACHARVTMEEVLDAGTYFVVVEGRRGGDHGFDLTLNAEPVSDACVGAPVISASGSFSGTTVGAGDDFRDTRVCGGGYGADLVYQVDVTERSRVVLDLIGGYPRPTIRLLDSCGGAHLAGHAGRARLDVRLEPGTYFAVIDGETPADEGSFVLNATLLPAL